nr:hypothetical protein Iba_chr13bCG4930 [Ipomoea batatas]
MCPGPKRLQRSHGPLSSLSVAHVPLSLSGGVADRVTWATVAWLSAAHVPRNQAAARVTWAAVLAVSGPCAAVSELTAAHVPRIV